MIVQIIIEHYFYIFPMVPIVIHSAMAPWEAHRNSDQQLSLDDCRWMMIVKVICSTTYLKGWYTHANQTVREPFANQMHICVDGTANIHRAICEWFAYHSLRTKICWFFAQTQRELGESCALCSSQVGGKLIYQVRNANCLRTIHKALGSHVCTGLNTASTEKKAWKCRSIHQNWSV